MKSALIAAAALAGSAQAGIHKMKLQKISLEEQLVCLSPHTLELVVQRPVLMQLFAGRRFH